MQITRVPVGAFITNCYIAEGQEPGRGFLVDPADNPKKLISILEEKQIYPEAILLTHGHYDHILAVPKLQERWKEIPVYCNAKDIPESLTEYDMGQQFPTVRAFKNVKTIEDGQTLVIAGTDDMIRADETRRIAESIPNAQLTVLKGDHFLANKNPKAFNETVLQFLRGD